MGAIENPVIWVRCSQPECSRLECGHCGNQIVMSPDHPEHWHVGSVTGSPYDNACKHLWDAMAAEQKERGK